VTEVRDSLGWGQRRPEERPRVSICIEPRIRTVLGHERDRYVWFDKEVNDCLYACGRNPFATFDLDRIVPANVGSMKDAIDPEFEREVEEEEGIW